MSSTQKHVDRKERERRQKLDLFTDIMLASDIRDCFCFMIYYYIFKKMVNVMTSDLSQNPKTPQRKSANPDVEEAV